MQDRYAGDIGDFGKKMKTMTFSEYSSDASAIFGYPDDLKLRSSMTLFAEADPHEEVFRKVLDKFFGGAKDERTLEIPKTL